MSEQLEEREQTDVELLLLSWTQMVAMEMITPNDEETLAAKTDLSATLMSDFDVTDLALIERTFEHYEVAYREKGELKSIQFDVDEVESIYDL